MNEVKIKGWVAREKSGLYFYSLKKPIRQIDNTWDSWDDDWVVIKNGIADLSWKDEPIEVEITIKAI